MQPRYHLWLLLYPNSLAVKLTVRVKYSLNTRSCASFVRHANIACRVLSSVIAASSG